VTNQPDAQHFSGSVEGVASGTEGGGFNHTENAMINVPIVQDIAAIRVVATDKYIEGWIDRDVLNPFPLETNNSTTRGNVAGAPVSQQFGESNWESLQQPGRAQHDRRSAGQRGPLSALRRGRAVSRHVHALRPHHQIRFR
jgi:hypothetical protein